MNKFLIIEKGCLVLVCPTEEIAEILTTAENSIYNGCLIEKVPAIAWATHKKTCEQAGLKNKTPEIDENTSMKPFVKNITS